MNLRIKLPGGTLKLKPYKYLRTAEINGKVPVWRLGGHYLVWWPNDFVHRHHIDKA